MTEGEGVYFCALSTSYFILLDEVMVLHKKTVGSVIYIAVGDLPVVLFAKLSECFFTITSVNDYIKLCT